MNIMHAIEVIAHRGGGAARANPDAPPENTAPAFQWAFDHGCAACECDVQLTRDGEVVVFHDADAQRAAGLDKPIRDMTLAELRQLDVGRWKHERWAGARVSTLGEVIGLVPREAMLLVEVKPGPQIIESLARVIGATSPWDGAVVLASFNIDTIRRARAALPGIACLWVIGFEQEKPGRWRARTRRGDGEGERVDQPTDVEQLIRTLRDEGFAGIDASREHPPDLGAALLGAGLVAGVWTVNDVADAMHQIEAGFRWITTDLPLHLHKGLTTHGIAPRRLNTANRPA